MNTIKVVLEGGPCDGYKYEIEESSTYIRLEESGTTHTYVKAPSRFLIANDGDYQVFKFREQP